MLLFSSFFSPLNPTHRNPPPTQPTWSSSLNTITSTSRMASHAPLATTNATSTATFFAVDAAAHAVTQAG